MVLGGDKIKVLGMIFIIWCKGKWKMFKSERKNSIETHKKLNT